MSNPLVLLLSRPGGGGGGNISPDQGPFVITDEQFAGGAPEGLGLDATPAIKAAVAAARAITYGTDPLGEKLVRTVFVPPGQYVVNDTTFVDDGVIIEGSDWGASVVMDGTKRLPVFVVGVDDPLCTDTDRPDLFGILDDTACPDPGDRHGLYTGRLFLQLHDFDLSCGSWGYNGDSDEGFDYWTATDQLTMDFMLRRDPDHPLGRGVPLFGSGNGYGFDIARPVTVGTYADADNFLIVRVADETKSDEFDNNSCQFIFPIGTTRNVRVSVQIDLRNGVAAVWVNRVQVAVSVVGGSLAAGRMFRFNDDWPWMVAMSGQNGATRTVPLSVFTLCGCHYSRGLLYSASGVGSPQVRLDAAPITDLTTYFTYHAGSTMGLLPLTGAVSSRYLTVVGADGRPGAALLMTFNQAGGNPTGIKNLSIHTEGTGILLGNVLDWEMSGLRIHAKTGVCVGAVNVDNAYPIDADRCKFESLHLCVRGWRWVFGTWTKIELALIGRHGLLFRGCDLKIDGLTLYFNAPFSRSAVTYYPYESFSSRNLVDWSMFDTESYGFLDAVIVAWAHQTIPTKLTVTNVECAVVGTDLDNTDDILWDHPAPILWLRNAPGAITGATARCVSRSLSGIPGTVSQAVRRDEDEGIIWTYTSDSPDSHALYPDGAPPP